MSTAQKFPIFIIGSPRSGTSMLHWALCQHEMLWGSEESELLVPMLRYLERVYHQAKQFEGRNWLEAQQVDKDEFYLHMGKGIEALYASRAGHCHWIEQTPSNTWVLPGIRQLFPSARYLYIHRDGRQVVESMTSMWPWSFRKAARTWRDGNCHALQFERDFPHATRRVSYESLVQNPNNELQAIWQFLGLKPCRESARFISDKQPINASPDHRDQDRMQKLVPRFDKWSLSKRLVFGKIAGQQMLDLGYWEET